MLKSLIKYSLLIISLLLSACSQPRLPLLKNTRLQYNPTSLELIQELYRVENLPIVAEYKDIIDLKKEIYFNYHLDNKSINNDLTLEEVYKIRKLEEQVNLLQKQVDSLSQTIALLMQQRDSEDAQDDLNKVIQEAQIAFDSGQYPRVIRLLVPHNIASGADGNIQAQEGMWLLIQSHFKLQHCESAIPLARKFMARFVQNPHAPDALLLIADCQNSSELQQTDIARDTLRLLIKNYPNSEASYHAKQRDYYRK